MLNFQPLQLTDIRPLRQYFASAMNKACDYTVGGTWMWRDFFKTEYALFRDTLIMKSVYLHGETAFSMPIGADYRAAAREVDDYARAMNFQTVFCTVAEEDVDRLAELFAVTSYHEPDWDDYLYPAESLKTFSGKHYHGQRNHLNTFLREHRDVSFSVLDEQNLPAVLDFYRNSALIDAKDSALFREEQDKTFEVLENFGAYGMQGGVVSADGRVAAFSLGEIKGDTLFCHIEKADPDLPGAYQAMVSLFAEHYATGDVRWINREEDAGDTGLRTSKQAYHPCAMVRKYTVTVTGRN